MRSLPVVPPRINGALHARLHPHFVQMHLTCAGVRTGPSEEEAEDGPSRWREVR